MPNSDYDFSIVIVTFNNRAIIRSCVASLSAALREFSTQLVIIDNASGDGTAALLAEDDWWKQLSFAAVERMYNADNRGYTRGVNQGLARCTGRFILMLNPDIIFGDNQTSEVFKTSEVLPNPDITFRASLFDVLLAELQDENIGVVAPQLRYLTGQIQPSCRRLPRKRDVLFEFLGLATIFRRSAFFNGWRMPDFDHHSSRDVAQPQGAFLLARREVVETVGLLDETFPMFFSDVEWCRRVIERGWRIRFCAEAFVYHAQGASVRQKRARMILSSHQSFVAYFHKFDQSWFDRCTTGLVHLLLLMATPLRLLPLLNRL